jgi:glycosyltransferase involved in cell wall biosynthesis
MAGSRSSLGDRKWVGLNSHSSRGHHSKLAIVVVAYFAEKTLRHVLEQIPSPIRERCVEIIVLDDASTDHTTQIGEACKKEWGWKNLTIIHNEKNLGYGGNQKKGYHLCMDKNYDVVVMLHGDAQYPPSEIPNLIAPLENNSADMSFGSRMTGKPLKGGMPLWKFAGNKFLTTYANLTLGMDLSEYHSGFRAYRIDALKKIDLDGCSDNFVFDTDIVIEFKKKGLRITESTIPTHYGPESRQIRPIPVFRYGLQIMKRTTLYALKHR